MTDKWTAERDIPFSFSERDLAQAAMLVRSSMAAIQPDAESAKHDFSQAFHAKMGALVKKQRVRYYAARGLKGVTSAAAVFALCAGLWLGTNAEARAEFTRWLLVQYENSFIYEFSDRGEMRTLKSVEFGWLPNGYLNTAFELDEDSGFYLFTNSEEKAIVFRYFFMSPERYFEIPRDGVEYETAKVNGALADYYKDLDEGDPNILWWADEKAGIAFDLNAALEKEELIRIAENIRLIFG